MTDMTDTDSTKRSFAARVAVRVARVALRAALKEYVDAARDKLCCLHCGAAQQCKQQQRSGDAIWYVIWHHPDGDGHLGRVSDLVGAGANNSEIDAEIARCVPLCKSCHRKEHEAMRRRLMEQAA